MLDSGLKEWATGRGHSADQQIDCEKDKELARSIRRLKGKTQRKGSIKGKE